jgi:hypothetical protein
MNGYPIEPSHLNLDVYRLLLPFAASRGLHDISRGDAPDPLNQMRKQFERSEACRLLLTVAVTVRNGIEKRCDPLVEHHLDASVGTLVEDVATPSNTPLTFREACHKIIHATDVEFGVEQRPEEERLAPLTMQIKLFGEKPVRGKALEWEATLDVAEFGRHAYALT